MIKYKNLGKICKRVGKEAIKVPVFVEMCLVSTIYVATLPFTPDPDEDPAIPFYEWTCPPRTDPFKPQEDLVNIIKAHYKYIINDPTWKKNWDEAFEYKELSDYLKDNQDY